MKIICTDNFDRENTADRLIAENVHKDYCSDFVKFLNDKFSGDYEPNYFKAVEDDYELFIPDY
jgi:hypothetical protein